MYIHHGRAGNPRPTSDQYPIPVYMGDGPSSDAFGRLRVSEPTTIFDSSQEYNSHPLLFEHVLVGTGDAVHFSAANATILTTGGAAPGARAFRQTKTYWRYQPGKSHLVKMTGTFLVAGTHADGSFTQMGYGDDDNGFFVRHSAAGFEIVKRSDTGESMVETVVPQSAWSVDRLNGESESLITLDATKSQIVVIDLQWLAVGRVRVGFQIDGRPFYAHEFVHANRAAGAYMRTANLPIRWEAHNVGAGANVSMAAICASIESEGGFQNSSGYLFTASTAGTQVACANTVALTPILSMRVKDLFGGITYRGHVRPVGLEALVSSNSAYWELRWNASLTDATFVNDADLAHSGVEFDTAATAVADGVVVASGYFSAGSGNARLGNAIGIATKLLLGRTYGNTRDTLTLAARGVGGVSNVAAAIAFDELY